ncbi:unnamed protein product, partial [Bubo scandiacus]
MAEGLDRIPVHKPEDGRDYTSLDDTVNLFKVEVSNNGRRSTRVFCQRAMLSNFSLYYTFPHLVEVSISLIRSEVQIAGKLTRRAGTTSWCRSVKMTVYAVI